MAEVNTIVPGRRYCPTIRWEQQSATTKTTRPQTISVRKSAETKTPDVCNLKIEPESIRSYSAPVTFNFYIQYSIFNSQNSNSILKFNIQIQYSNSIINIQIQHSV